MHPVAQPVTVETTGCLPAMPADNGLPEAGWVPSVPLDVADLAVALAVEEQKLFKG